MIGVKIIQTNHVCAAHLKGIGYMHLANGKLNSTQLRGRICQSINYISLDF